MGRSAMKARAGLERSNLAPTYETDYCGWAVEQSTLLRDGDAEHADLANIAEELSGLAKAEFHKLVSADRVLLRHMLKWDHQPDKRSRSRALSIAVQRVEIADLIADSPSLKPRASEAIECAYRRALGDRPRNEARSRGLSCPLSLRKQRYA